MPIEFLNNYPKKNLESSILKPDGSPLEGEIWVYRQFLQFNENNLLPPNETWFIKHNFNLSTHPASKNKIEGQIDFLVLSKHGLLVIEVKGGGLKVDENDCYYSYNKFGAYKTQNPFNQAKEYVHTLKLLNESSNLFVYRAIILPHESGFELKGPQLVGYQDVFYSKNNYKYLESDIAINKSFFQFIWGLRTKTRRHNIKELHPNWDVETLNKRIYEYYPELSSKDLNRIKRELFPSQSSYGFNPERINSEIILNENYEILKGLRRNQKVMVQGAPGTGKTVLALKFLAENLLKQHNGIVYCANKLIKSKLEYLIITEHELDPNSIDFKIYSDSIEAEQIRCDVDFLIFDEAQEYFDKGLFDFIAEIDKKLDKPRILLLYDPEQCIISDFKELAWYTDFFISFGFVHYYFDVMYRCIQSSQIADISRLIIQNQHDRIKTQYPGFLHTCGDTVEKLRYLKSLIEESRFISKEKIVLVNTTLIDDFKEIVTNYFVNDFEEVTETNINLLSNKIRYTTPIKYRGLENKCIYLITDDLNDKSKVQNYVGVTRAIELITIILWD